MGMFFQCAICNQYVHDDHVVSHEKGDTGKVLCDERDCASDAVFELLALRVEVELVKSLWSRHAVEVSLAEGRDWLDHVEPADNEERRILSAMDSQIDAALAARVDTP